MYSGLEVNKVRKELYGSVYIKSSVHDIITIGIT